MYRPLTSIVYLVLVALPFAANIQAAEIRWNLNDVSYLFPLPREHDRNAVRLLSPDSAGRRGALLPAGIRNELPPLFFSGDGNQTLFERQDIRVVGVRVDPCPDLDRRSCAPEVRMVWQPVQFDRLDGRWTVRDAAIHSIYRLSKTEFEQLREKLWALKIAYDRIGITTRKRPLGVHPALSDPATARAFNDRIRRILLDHCGERNLVRVSFMSSMLPAVWWRFGAFERNGQGGWSRFVIPRLGATSEDIFNVAREEGLAMGAPGKEMDAVFNVLPDEYPKADDIFALINDGFRQENGEELSVFKTKLGAVARFRNPHKTNFHTLDCAACHYADAARFYAERRFPELKDYRPPGSYCNPDASLFNLENTTSGRAGTRVLRGFGYFEDQPAINRRVIHESAESAHWLNTHD